jgi:hypothetical protein
MSGKTNCGRRRLRRAGLPAAVLASVALLTAACSDDPAKPSGSGQKAQVGGSSQQGGSKYQQAVDYAKCIRDNGDPSFPDPNSDGDFVNNNGSVDLTSAAHKKAAEACKDKAPQGGANGGDQAAGVAQLLKYSQCMRQNGLKEYPDPTSKDGTVGIEIGPDSGIDPNSAVYKKAAEACRSLQVGGG